MKNNAFTEGVKPGGLTTGTEIRILLCYVLDNIPDPVSRQQLEDVLLGEELANYFVMAESLSLLQEQNLVTEEDGFLHITPQGRSVASTLGDDLPRSVREVAVNSIIRAQQFAARAAAYHSEISETDSGRLVHCSIGDDTGPLFQMDLYMPDESTAKAVQKKFIEGGDEVYKLLLAALTNNRTLAEKALQKLK